MGRFYSGDIEGKFWPGVQNSNAADRFGVYGEDQEGYLNYSFSEDDLPDLVEELENIKKNLGVYLDKLNAYFDKRGDYNSETIRSFLKVDHSVNVMQLISEYADYLLGTKILNEILNNRYCEFMAEL